MKYSVKVNGLWAKSYVNQDWVQDAIQYWMSNTTTIEVRDPSLSLLENYRFEILEL